MGASQETPMADVARPLPLYSNVREVISKQEATRRLTRLFTLLDSVKLEKEDGNDARVGGLSRIDPERHQ